MATDDEDAPGALSLSNADYQLDGPANGAAGSLQPLETKHLDRKGSIAGRLPREIIEQIFYLVDPETFASLVLVNRAWRNAAEDPRIYAFHLSQCPSYSPTHKALREPFKEDSLLHFKRLLVQEAKRYLFEVFMRPHKTTINLISTTTSSSAAFPYGEKFEFTFAPRGGHCLAISSSRIIVLDTGSLDVCVKKELKVVRRPLSASILYNGSLLGVLTTPHKINLYDLSEEKVRLVKAIELEEASHTISLSIYGEVVAAANENGVEVVSLGENALPTEKRTVKCDRVDNLMFACDGTILLGTTQNSKTPATVVLSAPYFTDVAEHDMDHAQLISHMWTSQIIFPNSSRDCSHAVLLPRKADHDAHWTLTYDQTFESFRAVRTDDLRNGTTYFTGPNPRRERERQRSKSALVPQTIPTITPGGEVVAAAFLGSEIWMYGVPEDLDNAKSTVKYENIRAGEPLSGSAISGPSHQHDTLPRWQMLVDKYRNVFAKGRRIANVTGVTNICWQSPLPPCPDEPLQNIKERLIIAAPGGLPSISDIEFEEMPSLDGGRIVCLDFNWTPQSGAEREITIEIGTAEPQLLEEEARDMDTEIAIVRRRTVARREALPRSMVSSVAEVLRPTGEEPPPVPPVQNSVGFGLEHTAEEAPAATETADPPSPTSSVEGPTIEEAVDAFDGPYSHTNPRSRTTLYRSATAVEANRRRNPPTIPASGRVEFRRTDGTELPHESDADNWVPPPPPYTKEAEDPLPHHLRHILMSQTSISPMHDPADNSTPTPPERASQNAGASRHSRQSSATPSAENTNTANEQSLNISARPMSLPAGISTRSSNASASTPAVRPSRASIQVLPQTSSQSRQPPPLTIPRRPVGQSNNTSDNRLSTITDASSRRRSAAETERASAASPSWLSRHDSNRSRTPESHNHDSARPASYHYSHSASTTPNSRSPPPTSRRPLSNYEHRSSLYRAALQPASSISPIKEPVAPPQARHDPRCSISSTTSTRRSASLTLSGTNLQQRLDYPLPPRPPANGEHSQESPPTPTRTDSFASGREVSPLRSHPAEQFAVSPQSSPALSQPVSQPPVPSDQSTQLPPPSTQPTTQTSSSSIQPSTQTSVRSTPTPQPPPELSAYQMMQQQIEQQRAQLQQVQQQQLDQQRAAQEAQQRQAQQQEVQRQHIQQQQIQNLPAPPPVPSSTNSTMTRKRSARIRSPFRFSSTGVSRATSTLSLRAKATEQQSNQATHQQPPRQQSHPLPPSQPAQSSDSHPVASKPKNRLSRRISRVFHGDGGRDKDVPPVPPVPALSNDRTGTEALGTGNAARGRRMAREEEDGAWGGVGARLQGGNGGVARPGAGSAGVAAGGSVQTAVTGGTQKKKGKKDKDGKCIVM